MVIKPPQDDVDYGETKKSRKMTKTMNEEEDRLSHGTHTNETRIRSIEVTSMRNRINAKESNNSFQTNKQRNRKK